MNYQDFYFGEHDDIVTDDLKRTVGRLSAVLNNERVFIEIGAHIGFVGVPVVTNSKPKRSFLFEPHSGSAAYLRLNLKKFVPVGVEYHVIEKMVMDKVGRSIYYYFDSPPHGSFYKRTQDAKTWEMDCVTVDSVAKEYGIKEDIVMKIDAELAEPFIWKGMKESMPQIKFIVIEFLPNHMSHDLHIEPKDFIKEIESDGYTVEGLKGQLRDNEIYQPAGNKVDLVLRRND